MPILNFALLLACECLGLPALLSISWSFYFNALLGNFDFISVRRSTFLVRLSFRVRNRIIVSFLEFGASHPMLTPLHSIARTYMCMCARGMFVDGLVNVHPGYSAGWVISHLCLGYCVQLAASRPASRSHGLSKDVCGSCYRLKSFGTRAFLVWLHVFGSGAGCGCVYRCCVLVRGN